MPDLEVFADAEQEVGVGFHLLILLAQLLRRLPRPNGIAINTLMCVGHTLTCVEHTLTCVRHTLTCVLLLHNLSRPNSIVISTDQHLIKRDTRT